MSNAGPIIRYDSTEAFRDLRMGPDASLVQAISNTVARTDTSAKDLFVLPAGATILFWAVHAPVASNAGTSALLTVGVDGNGDLFIDDLSLLTITGWFIPNSNSANGAAVVATPIGAVGATDVTVEGTYTESGSASNTGGPWTVTCFFTVSPRV